MSIHNGPNTLKSLFNDNVFIVPAFQRAFAWDKPQLRNFIDDLRSHPAKGNDKNRKEYFFETILLTIDQNCKPNPLYESYAIVDGQQRLTTSCIFFAVAIAKLKLEPSFKNTADIFSERILKKIKSENFTPLRKTITFLNVCCLLRKTMFRKEVAIPHQRKDFWKRKFFLKKKLATLRFRCSTIF